MRGLWLKTMYGTRDASSTWQKGSTSLLQKHGFRTGQAWPCIFLHEERPIRLLVHGDDFLVLADEEGHAIADRVLRERYEFKCGGHIGPGQTKQRMSVLNRITAAIQIFDDANSISSPRSTQSGRGYEIIGTTPHESAYNDLKRLGRYLRGRQRPV